MKGRQDRPSPPSRKLPRDGPRWGPGTLSVHAGDSPDLNAGAVVGPIYQTSTFRFPAPFSEAGAGQTHLYTRLKNPTLTQAGAAVSALEGGEEGRVFSSGMAALSAVVLGRLHQGDEVVAPEDLYGNTVTLLKQELPRWGVRVRFVPASQSSEVSEHVTERTRLLLVESPTNPTLRVVDLAAWAKAARAAGAWLVVDNTFATPVNQRPLGLGAHVVMHSATKYLGGHSDLLAGALASGPGLLGELDAFAATLGGTLDPLAGFLLLRGMKTLSLRVARHNENARAVVEELQGHPKVSAIGYPGRASSEEERICRRQMKGRGGMVSLVLKGGLPEARRFLRGLSLFQVASSLGGVESLVSLPLETSHRAMSRRERERRGIADSMARLSLGIEDAADLVADLKAALRSV